MFQATAHDNEVAMSIEDLRFMEIMEKETRKNELGNWEMPLPLRSPDAILPNNRNQVVGRLNNLLCSFRRKPQLENDYFEFMDKLSKRGHAVSAPMDEVPRSIEDDVSNLGERKRWYLPHFGVYHPRKPNQIRVVFDLSAEFQGVSLNKELLPGPDVLKGLHGVLIRFRQDNFAIMCDIEQMFHCFHVDPAHRDMLRFLWFKDDDRAKEIIEYHMVVHLFGNTCSPAIATFGLRKTAEDGEERFGRAAEEFVHNDFYVDDGLMSRPTEDEAIKLVRNTQAMLDTQAALPKEDRAASIRDLDLNTFLCLRRQPSPKYTKGLDAIAVEVYRYFYKSSRPCHQTFEYSCKTSVGFAMAQRTRIPERERIPYAGRQRGVNNFRR